jgi:hypothetical protein
MSYIPKLLSMVVIAVSPLHLPALAQATAPDAPLGLVWGNSSSEIQAIELKEIDRTDFGESFIASKLDKAPADQSAALHVASSNDVARGSWP